MNEEEFTAFLQPFGLYWEWTNKQIIDTSGFDIGPGWYEITAKLITDLIDLGWNKRIYQVKDKFGGGRFYIDETPAFYDRIRTWEAATFETCSSCGKRKVSNRRRCNECSNC